jgi:tRNA(fMet)-specific endonuclease VapC
MSEQFLLDTDICSFIIKGTHPFLDVRLRELSPEQTLISAVTRAELRFGLAKRPNAIRLAEKEKRGQARFYYSKRRIRADSFS